MSRIYEAGIIWNKFSGIGYTDYILYRLQKQDALIYFASTY